MSSTTLTTFQFALFKPF